MSSLENNLTNETNKVTNKKPYTGDRAPMVNMSMLKTSKAVNKAIGRIEKRQAWIKNQKEILLENFNSNKPSIKRDAHVEALKLHRSIPALKEKKHLLEEKLPEIEKEELSMLEELEFPELDI
jgi:hypothetical protein